ncbi:MAG: ATP-binding cassette domain-containing protein, partial [Actinomycetota bacterium]
MSEAAVEIEGLWKNFRMYHERNRYIKAALLRGRRARYNDFWALQDVSVSIKDGETVGFIGANGSGKSTLLKCLTGIYQPNRGSVKVQGKIAALLELGAGFS